MTHEFVYYLLSVSLSHSHRQYGRWQSATAVHGRGDELDTERAGTDFSARARRPPGRFEAALVWNKLLLVHLNVLLSVISCHHIRRRKGEIALQHANLCREVRCLCLMLTTNPRCRRSLVPTPACIRPVRCMPRG